MISQSVLARADAIREEFVTAAPFKHVCIDDFLVDAAAEQALRDFPSFDKRNAINEFGQVGGKAVNTKLGEISPFYAGLYKFLFSEDFLSAMSRITGISDLIGDPTMYGGGTHENRHGQELDPHIDFNYIAGGNAHRRVNLLIYLNKGWDERWGGDLEIHSNPREPETDEIKRYPLVFNRAVLFETNEYSWHGFPRIALPADLRETDSRKCISIYLYTRTRPAHEIAGTHGTFYVQRPVGKDIVPGHVLTEEDVAELRAGYRKRDMTIEAYQKLEERLGRDIEGLHRYLDGILATVGPRILGFVSLVRRVSGSIWHDGWVGASCVFEMRAARPVTAVEMRGRVPDLFRQPGMEVSLAVNGQSVSQPVASEDVVLRLPLTTPLAEGEQFELSLTSNKSTNLKRTGKGDDDRDMAFVISSMVFEDRA